MSADPRRADRGGGSGTARAFVALALEPATGARVLAQVERELGGSAAGQSFRIPSPAGLHQTLFFLGSVARERLAEIGSELGPALAGLPAPRLWLGRSGAFPSAERARVLWIGVEERAGTGRLVEVRAAVLGALGRTGFDTSAEEAQAFRPHVTVARPRERRTPIPSGFFALELGLDWDPCEVTLFESLLGGGPARYEPLVRIPLAPG